MQATKEKWYTKPSYLLRLYSEYCADIGFRKAINEYLIYKTTRNEAVKGFLQKLLYNLENFIIQIVGHIRSGKSRMARKWIRLYCTIARKNMRIHMDARKPAEFKEFIIDPGFSDALDVYVTYSFTQSEYILKNVMQEGDIVFQDEMPSDRGKGSRNIVKDIENVLKIASGKKRLNFIFINPITIQLDTIDYYVRILGVNKKERLTLAMVSLMGFNKNKFIHEGVIKLSVDEDPELTEYYESESERIKTEIMSRGGASTVECMDQDELVEMLLDEVEKASEPIMTKKAMESFARNVGTRYMQDGNYDRGMALQRIRDSKFFDEIVSDAYNYLKAAGKTKSKDADMDDIEVSVDGEFLVDAPKLLESYPTQRDAAIWIEYQDPRVKQDELAEKHGLDQSTISRNMGEVDGWLNDRIGKLYEKYALAKLEARWRDDTTWELIEIKNEGQQGKKKPDIRVDLKRKSDGVLKTIFYSIKCYNSTRKSVSIPIDELDPEINAARQMKDKFPDQVVQCVLYFYNRATKEVIEKEIRYLEPPKSIFIKSSKSRQK